MNRRTFYFIFLRFVIFGLFGVYAQTPPSNDLQLPEGNYLLETEMGSVNVRIGGNTCIDTDNGQILFTYTVSGYAINIVYWNVEGVAGMHPPANAPKSFKNFIKAVDNYFDLYEQDFNLNLESAMEAATLLSLDKGTAATSLKRDNAKQRAKANALMFRLLMVPHLRLIPDKS